MLNSNRDKTLFAPRSTQTGKLLVCLIVSIVLMITDYHKHYLVQIRHECTGLFVSIYRIIDSPYKIMQYFEKHFISYNQLIEENESLRQQQFLLKGYLQKFQALEEENDRLRGFLNTVKHSRDRLLLAEVLQVDPDPFVHQMILNKGSEHGAYVGQPIIDENGILGEIIEVTSLTSRALFITDSSYAVPVEILRTGTRAIISGTSALDKLQLQYIADSNMVKIGDQLVTSGLGGRYPSGYPVGTVKAITYEADDVFAKIWVTPAARLTRSTEVLLLFPRTDGSKHTSVHLQTRQTPVKRQKE